MVTYKCFFCDKKISNKTLEKGFICPNCGGRIFLKARTKIKKVKAV